MEKTFDRSAAFLIFNDGAINISSIKKVYTDGCLDCDDYWYKSIVIDLFEENRFKKLSVFNEADEFYINEIYTRILSGLYNNNSLDLREVEKTLKNINEMNE